MFRGLLHLNFALTDNATRHLHELPVPEEVTDCSECGNILDQIKYICATCGEKTPMSRTVLAAAAAGVSEGDSRASPDYHHHENSTEYEL
jgi:predicted amidophosphoribosyltransferase